MLKNYARKQSIKLGVESLNSLVKTMDKIKDTENRLKTIEKVKTIKIKTEIYGKYH